MSWAIREATVEDIPDLVTLRRAMFEAMGHEDSEILDLMCEASGRCFERHVRPGRFAPGSLSLPASTPTTPEERQVPVKPEPAVEGTSHQASPTRAN